MVLMSCATWSYKKASHAAADIMHVAAGTEAGPACGLSNKFPHAVIPVAQQLLGAGAGRLGHPVVPLRPGLIYSNHHAIEL